MIKRAILKIQKETGATPYEIMQAFLYGAIWATIKIGSIYPACWVLVKIAELLGR